MKRVVVVISARASYSRIRSVLLQLLHNRKVELHVVLSASASASTYGKLGAIIERDNIPISWKIDSQIDASLSSSMAKTVGLTMFGLVDYLQNIKADGIVIVADRHETLAGSIAGSFLGIKTFHVQGGEITGNIDDKVRNANSHLSDYHFVSNEAAARRLRDFGIQNESIFVTGCPSLDMVRDNRFDRSSIPELRGVGYPSQEVFGKKYIIVIQHPETTSSLSFSEQIMPTIDSVELSGIPALWIWPNSDLGGEIIVSEIRKAREKGALSLVHFEKTLEPEVFLSILDGASCIVGNSSVALREGALIGVPAVNIGGRQRNRLHGHNVLHVDYKVEEISEAIKKQTTKEKYDSESIYGDGQAGRLIANLIEELV